MAAVPIDLHAAMAPKIISGPLAREAGAREAGAPPGRTRYAAQPKSWRTVRATIAVPAAPANAGNTRTVTIIDGKTGARQDVVIPADRKRRAGPSAERPEVQRRSKIRRDDAARPDSKVAADGTRPAEAFAQPVKPIPGKPDAPRVALIVGRPRRQRQRYVPTPSAKLPGAVTLAFMPYGYDVDQLAGRARREGHEVLLQAPMEPFGYPDDDSGPQTLLTSLTPEQNLERLYWLMSRLHGYVGVAGAMGARFTASEQAFAPILSETGKRGLIFVDDGANPRSVAGAIAPVDVELGKEALPALSR